MPKLTGSPVLDSVRPVIERSRDVQTKIDRIVEVAGWMAYAELPMPDYALLFGIGAEDVNETIDFILTASCIETAFTDFSSHTKFESEYSGLIPQIDAWLWTHYHATWWPHHLTNTIMY